MSKPTMVSVISGPHIEGYTFCVTGKENTKFTCRYDGTEVKLNIYIQGTKVMEVLELVHGLLHKESDFKKKLYSKYPSVKAKRLSRIVFDSTTGYEFVVTRDSIPYELMKQYYRFYRYEVNDGETEEEIVSRQQEVFKRNLQNNLLASNSQFRFAQ
ncbi:MAG: hypothetical protein J6B87_00065 [Clostridia bacterium]|nr:hypothetical protein [Clostridia bacterium]